MGFLPHGFASSYHSGWTRSTNSRSTNSSRSTGLGLKIGQRHLGCEVRTRCSRHDRRRWISALLFIRTRSTRSMRLFQILRLCHSAPDSELLSFLEHEGPKASQHLMTESAPDRMLCSLSGSPVAEAPTAPDNSPCRFVSCYVHAPDIYQPFHHKR